MIFSWQIKQWQSLQQAHEKHRLPHALLFAGMAGTGKAIFAEQFSRWLLCETAQKNKLDAACADCHACRLSETRAHPNLLWIEPEKAGAAIKVDQVREVTEFVNQSSLQGDFRIVIIHPANNMNINAANALLKTLEEPANNALLLLISDQRTQLPATILSRCQHIHFPKPSQEEALSWLQTQLPNRQLSEIALLLKLAHGAPCAAFALAQDKAQKIRDGLLQSLYALSQKQTHPLKVASEIQEAELLTILDSCITYVMDVLRLKLSAPHDALTNHDQLTSLTALAPKIPQKEGTDFLTYLQALRGKIYVGANFNKQLLTETVLIKWVALCAK